MYSNEKLSGAVESLFARAAHGIKPGLEVTEALLGKLGNPHRDLKCIHVAGTNGKGSVCAMIESVLRASGLKTGLYTSPHLLRFNERFRISGREISDAELEKLIARVETAAQTLDTRPATFFEISTAMAFDYFNREKVDYAVIETGMGGRWDATNVILPVLSVITRIDMDHQEYLGAEIEKIAGEKAGIIKPGIPVICGPMPVEAEAVVYREAAEKKSPILGSDEAVLIHALERQRDNQTISIEASGHTYPNIRLPLAGRFQLENCALAVAALEDLADIENLRLQMKKGLETVRWPGRFQILQQKPPMIYDGAHNPSGARALLDAVQEGFPGFEAGFFFGFMKDKDVETILKTLAPAVQKAWAVTLPAERALSAAEIAGAGCRAGLEIEPADRIQPALEWLEAGKKRLVCFTGSLYLPEWLKANGISLVHS